MQNKKWTCVKRKQQESRFQRTLTKKYIYIPKYPDNYDPQTIERQNSDGLKHW